MKTILYVHGYNGNPYGGTFQKLRSYVSDDWNMISLDYDDRDADKAMTALDSAIDSKSDIKLVVGTSLGGFLALCNKSGVHKIVINPCYKPSAELPKIYVPEATVRSWEKYESTLRSGYPNGRVIGFFGDRDELLGDRYVKDFETDFQTTAIPVISGHDVSDDACKKVAAFINFLKDF